MDFQPVIEHQIAESNFSVRDWSGARISDTVGNLPFTEQTNADEIYAMLHHI